MLLTPLSLEKKNRERTDNDNARLAATTGAGVTAGVHSSCVTKQHEADSFKRSRLDGAYRVATFGCRELLPCGRTAVLVVSRYQKVP